MSYEEKYKEALKRADSLTEKYGGREFAEYVFPELAESEDERIRKEIIKYLKLVDKGEGDYAHPIVSGWIAYLEKQKEQKVDIDKLRRDLYQSGYNDGYQHGKEDAQKEQKPAEWSKNDTVFLNEITDFFENGTVRLQHDLSMYAHWLKCLPERFNLQPKQEWGEEDEKVISDSCCWIAEYAGYLMDKNYGKASMLMGLTDKLKSLRPQPHWKPGEEQMKALKWWSELPSCSPGLKSLYEDLKKL